MQTIYVKDLLGNTKRVDAIQRADDGKVTALFIDGAWRQPINYLTLDTDPVAEIETVEEPITDETVEESPAAIEDEFVPEEKPMPKQKTVKTQKAVLTDDDVIAKNE